MFRIHLGDCLPVLSVLLSVSASSLLTQFSIFGIFGQDLPDCANVAVVNDSPTDYPDLFKLLPGIQLYSLHMPLLL